MLPRGSAPRAPPRRASPVNTATDAPATLFPPAHSTRGSGRSQTTKDPLRISPAHAPSSNQTRPRAAAQEASEGRTGRHEGPGRGDGGRDFCFRTPVGHAPLTWPRGSRPAHPGPGRLRAPPAPQLLRLLRPPTQTPNQSPRPGTHPPSAPPGACGSRHRGHDSPPPRGAPAPLPRRTERPLRTRAPRGGRTGPQPLNAPLAAPHRCHGCQAARPPGRRVSPTSGPTVPCARRSARGRPRPRPRPAALALRFSSLGPAACAREGVFTATVLQMRSGSRLVGGMRASGAGLVRSRLPLERRLDARLTICVLLCQRQ